MSVPSVVSDTRLEDILKRLYRITGMDFSGYARPSIARRMRVFMHREGLHDPQMLADRLELDENLARRLVNTLTVHFTELFRDPEFFRGLREQVLPFLATYPTIRIWHAGCSTGEEVYSMAILLHEVELLHKTRIYATDINTDVLQYARDGAFSPVLLDVYEQNYRKAGGRTQFSDYCEPCGGRLRMKKFLRDPITFHQHNLITDAGFNEFHLILCRNVMIYFDVDLQERATSLFHESLVNLGYLAIGTRESLRFNRQGSSFTPIDRDLKIYRKVRFRKL